METFYPFFVSIVAWIIFIVKPIVKVIEQQQMSAEQIKHLICSADIIFHTISLIMLCDP